MKDGGMSAVFTGDPCHPDSFFSRLIIDFECGSENSLSLIPVVLYFILNYLCSYNFMYIYLCVCMDLYESDKIFHIVICPLMLCYQVIQSERFCPEPITLSKFKIC